MDWFGISSLLLLAICGWAVWTDIREHRIPNALSVGALASGLLLRVPMGMEAMGLGLASAGIAFLFGLFFFLLGGLGAGDVKFMTGAASFFDPGGLLLGLVVMSGVGVVMALVAAARAGVLGQTFRNLSHFFLTFGRTSFRGWKGESPAVTLRTAGKKRVSSPYGVAIAAGAVAAWFLPLFR